MSNVPRKYWPIKNPDMDQYEKSAIIGHYRNGCPFYMIGVMFGISEQYVEMILRDHLKAKGEKVPDHFADQSPLK